MLLHLSILLGCKNRLFMSQFPSDHVFFFVLLLFQSSLHPCPVVALLPYCVHLFYSLSMYSLLFFASSLRLTKHCFNPSLVLYVCECFLPSPFPHNVLITDYCCSMLPARVLICPKYLHPASFAHMQIIVKYSLTHVYSGTNPTVKSSMHQILGG